MRRLMTTMVNLDDAEFVPALRLQMSKLLPAPWRKVNDEAQPARIEKRVREACESSTSLLYKTIYMMEVSGVGIQEIS